MYPKIFHWYTHWRDHPGCSRRRLVRAARASLSTEICQEQHHTLYRIQKVIK
jgi:hypothetical protein